MKRLSIVIVALLVIGAGFYFFLNRTDRSEDQAPVLAGAPADASVLVRGEYLTRRQTALLATPSPARASPSQAGCPSCCRSGPSIRPTSPPTPTPELANGPTTSSCAQCTTACAATASASTRPSRTPRTHSSIATTCWPSRLTSSARRK